MVICRGITCDYLHIGTPIYFQRAFHNDKELTCPVVKILKKTEEVNRRSGLALLFNLGGLRFFENNGLENQNK
jgi:hypothetical protein